VAEVVGRARQSQLEGKMEEALDEVDRALVECPGEPRLVQLQSTLRNSLVSGSRVQTRIYYRKQLNELIARVAGAADPQQLRAAVDQARGIAARFPEDAELRTLAAEVEHQAVKQHTPPERRQPPTAPPTPSPVAPSAAADSPLARTPLPAPPPLESAETSALNATAFYSAGGSSSLEESETAALPIAAPPPAPPPTPSPGKPAGPSTATPQSPARQSPLAALAGLPRIVWLAIALVSLLAVVAGILQVVRRPSPAASKPAPVAQYSIQVQASLPGASIRIDGQSVEPGVVRLSAGAHTASAELAGYQPIATQFQAGPNAPPLHFEFVPALQRVRILTGLDAGKAVLDDAAAVDLQDGSFSDDNVSLAAHKLRITGRAGQTLSIAFSATAANPAILDEPVTNPDEVVISTMGKNAIVYCGAPSCQAGVKDRPLEPVPAHGLDLKDLAPNSELVVSDGKNARNLSIESATAPVLAIYLTTNDNTGTLRITSNVPDAQVTLSGNGQVQKRNLKDGKWSRKLTPGTWVVKVSKEGYLDAAEQHVDLAKGDTRALNFDLQPAAVSGKLAIDGAIPNTEIWIDGNHAGTVNSSGSFSGEVSPGAHDLELRKDGFENLTLAKRTFSAGQTLHLSASDVRMRAYGVVNFLVTPPGAQIFWRRAGDAQTHQVRNNTALPLPPGQYVVTASASKRETHEETVQVDPGKAATISWTLAAPKQASPQTPAQPVSGTGAFESADAWQEQNGWWFHKGPSFAWLKATRGAFSIDIARKGAGIFGAGGKIDWQIGYRDDRNRVTYQLDEHKLSRRAFVNGNKADHTASHSMKGDAYQLRIDIEPARITVRDANGNMLDDYSDTSADFTAGKFGFKGDVRLVVR
jgi:hypothetical protein